MLHLTEFLPYTFNTFYGNSKCISVPEMKKTPEWWIRKINNYLPMNSCPIHHLQFIYVCIASTIIMGPMHHLQFTYVYISSTITVDISPCGFWGILCGLLHGLQEESLSGNLSFAIRAWSLKGDVGKSLGSRHRRAVPQCQEDQRSHEQQMQLPIPWV